MAAEKRPTAQKTLYQQLSILKWIYPSPYKGYDIALDLIPISKNSLHSGPLCERYVYMNRHSIIVTLLMTQN